MSKLHDLRIQSHMSCADMSKKLNISKVHYWQIEHRKRKLYYDMAIKISNTFGMTPDSLFYEDYTR